jgi:hypothetical protein
MPEANGASTPPFLLVSILNADATGQLEVELANACIVRLKGAADPELVSAPLGWLTGGEPSSQTGTAKESPREEA